MAYLITAQQVVDEAFQDVNMFASKIKDAHIEVAQEDYLRPILGDDFYDHMVANHDQPPYVDLIADYLLKPLAFFVKYVVLPEVTISITALGMTMTQPEGTIAVSDKQAGLMREQAKNNAIALMNKAMRYIDDNDDTFTEYSQADSVDSEIKVLGGIIF